MLVTVWSPKGSPMTSLTRSSSTRPWLVWDPTWKRHHFMAVSSLPPDCATMADEPPGAADARLRGDDDAAPGRNPSARAGPGCGRPLLRGAHGRIRGRCDQDRDARAGR